jgi:glutamyl-tRNA synthetase
MNTNNQKIVTRMAPSPTGNLHIGGVRTALFNYLFAKHNKGTFIIRSEDTDKERSLPEYEKGFMDTFQWLGLTCDKFYRQSQRTDIYKEKLYKLIKEGKAYEAEASKDDPEKSVIRFKNPNTKITFRDLILGDIEFDTTELGDFVIARTIEAPIYHFVVVVDDGLMEVSHVLRGQEHINNTPRQILILEALGFSRPQYAHIPLIMSPRGGKLSKRDPEVVPALDYKKMGIIPEALLNFLAFIGWNPGDEREIMSLDDIIAEFDISKVQKSGGIFNVDKLYWTNKQYLNKLSNDEFKSYIDPLFTSLKSTPVWDEEVFNRIIPITRERIHHLGDLQAMIAEGELDYYFVDPEITEIQNIVWKKSDALTTKIHLEKVVELLTKTTHWGQESLKETIFPYAEEKGKGDVLWPIRYVLSGRDKSPDPFTLLYILGKEVSLRRIQDALLRINKNL